LNGSNTLNSVADGTITVAKVQQGVFDQAEDDATALAIALG